MINIDLLTFGCWVNYTSDSPKNAFPIQFTKELLPEFIKLNDRFEPLSIHAWMLEKNGFELDHESIGRNWESYTHESEHIEIKHLSDRYSDGWTCYVYNDNDGIIGCCDIVYVHQLQTFLKLCGVELSFEL